MKKNIFLNTIYKEIGEVFSVKKHRLIKNKKVLITGCSGLLGHYFIAFFLKSFEFKINPKKITLIHRHKLPSYLNFLKKKNFLK